MPDQPFPGRSPQAPLSLACIVRGSGYPIVCLHGHPGSGDAMSVFTDALSPQFRTIAPDLRGYGRSSVRQPFSMRDHLADLKALLDRQQVDSGILLGWSLGGILALELALQYPHRVSGLILVATAARPRSSHPATAWPETVNTGIAALASAINPDWQWVIDTFGRRSLFGYLIQQHTPATYRHIAREGIPAYLQTSRWATQALTQELRQGYNRLEDLPAIQCPCLMLSGECDRHITAASSLETAQALADCDYHCYPNTAHLFPWEIPEQVMADIGQWLNKHQSQWHSTPNSYP
ncbi:MAG: alpha/beta hydrolase [Synechococcales bacterium]|nr:alpha/beta hydrolase [Synechococcales bacterium]